MDSVTQQLMMGAAGGAGAAKLYVEDVFSTWLYTGNGSTQTITNGIDLSGKGGMIWTKVRDFTYSPTISDTARGVNFSIETDSTSSQTDQTTGGITSTSSTGYSLGNFGRWNGSGYKYASWTFRKAAKFFDVVTYTGTGSAQAVSHNLGTAPGFIVAKQTNNTSDWIVYHRSSGATKVLTLNSTGAEFTAGHWDNTTPTSTQFYVGGGGVSNNLSGGTYVAYLFAHDAGGFGDSGNDNVVSCGSYTGNGSTTGPTVTLGWEPQWLLIKRSSGFGEWVLLDAMRGIPVGSADARLFANDSLAEGIQDLISPTSTGFQLVTTNNVANGSGDTYIYIAIRRGPMRTPTDATKVFSAVARTGAGTNPTTVTTNTNPDLLMSFPRTASPAAYGMCCWDKLRGVAPMLQSAAASAETSTDPVYTLKGWMNTGFQAGADFISGYLNYSGSSYINYVITRAPGFFDVVAYTGTGAARTVSHNLGVAPELMIVKCRSGVDIWPVYAAPVGPTRRGRLEDAGSFGTSSSVWNNTAPTSSVFTVGIASGTNNSGSTFIAYLFASCPGVSKVGSYTGTGTTLQVNCGFTAGARFVLIKRADETGDWYVWDSARGIIAANDPYLLLNSTAAEVTNTDYIDPLNSGFEISSTAPAAINANGGTYIYLAIA